MLRLNRVGLNTVVSDECRFPSPSEESEPDPSTLNLSVVPVPARGVNAAVPPQNTFDPPDGVKSKTCWEPSGNVTVTVWGDDAANPVVQKRLHDAVYCDQPPEPNGRFVEI